MSLGTSPGVPGNGRWEECERGVVRLDHTPKVPIRDVRGSGDGGVPEPCPTREVGRRTGDLNGPTE